MKSACRSLFGLIAITLAPALCANDLCAQGDPPTLRSDRSAHARQADGDGTGQGGTGRQIEADKAHSKLPHICEDNLDLRNLPDTSAILPSQDSLRPER
jgi:hypothetical protein